MREGHDFPEHSFVMNTTFVKAVGIVDCSHKNTQMICRNKWPWTQLDLKELQGHIRKGTKAQNLLPRRLDTTHIFSFYDFFLWHYYIFLNFHLSLFYLLLGRVCHGMCVELRG